MRPASTPQLADYLRLRGEGCAIATAAEESGLPVDAAWEAEAAVQRGELKFTRGEDKMARDTEQVKEAHAPDFAKMKRIFLNDIKPAEEHNAKSRGELSAAWKAIETECACNKRAAKLLHKLYGESEETRDDFLRTLFGGMRALNIGISQDLVDKMSDQDAPTMPVVASKGLGTEGLASLETAH